MVQFPQELVDQISSYLTRDTLKSTLTVSNQFRFAAERYSGAFSRFVLEDDNAETFLNIYSGHRLCYLRQIEFYTRLPRLDFGTGKLVQRRENADQLRTKDEIFTQQIQFLFRTIRTVEERAGLKKFSGKIRLKIYAPTRLVSKMLLGQLHHYYISWRIHLLQPENLHQLRSIRSLELEQGCLKPAEQLESDYGLAVFKLDLRVMVDLAVKFPNLEYWGCRLGGDEWTPKWQQDAVIYLTHDWEGPRRDSRHDFARALGSARLPDSLRCVRLDLLYPLDDSLRIDHHQMMPDLVSPEPNDPFSVGLRNLSQHLRRLQLRGVIDETLFWPGEDFIPCWPNLESLDITFHMVSPAGSWYFVGPNGEGLTTAASSIGDSSYPPFETTAYDREMDEEYDDEAEGQAQDRNVQFRIVPNDLILRPFLVAFAKAATNMTNLREAAIWSPLTWDPGHGSESELEFVSDWVPKDNWVRRELAWGIAYVAPGEWAFDQKHGDDKSEVRQFWWKVAKWRPDPELHDLFQDIGRQKYGEDYKEYWRDNTYGRGLVDRQAFEYFTDITGLAGIV